ncbi:UDP-phosphate galactose phosphotransferase [Aeromonas hydrophila]|uniref:sugar transferase n=1 Tax=Aeromonas hydrophila TaxID=644 RepID=UPI0015DBEA53|nr:sugar transferase [Aeromonas hydrophila]BBT05957.1 UDP-phosphate galactose phosphotransferase [Aeromonas hydrophila]
MKRFFDFIMSFLMLFILSPVILIIYIAIVTNSKGGGIYWSKRVGVNNTIFLMPKFRTMYKDTPTIATHLLTNPDSHLTSIGGFLRKSSLDELPQLWCVLSGSMSLVGPRPALYNQDDLIKLRTDNGVHKIKPGITGLAQINGRDELTIYDKVALDAKYLNSYSFFIDLKILFLTLFKVIKKDGVSH